MKLIEFESIEIEYNRFGVEVEIGVCYFDKIEKKRKRNAHVTCPSVSFVCCWSIRYFVSTMLSMQRCNVFFITPKARAPPPRPRFQWMSWN